MQDAIGARNRRRRQNTMYPRMRVAVLLQGDLFIRSGICGTPIPLIAFGYYVALHLRAIYLQFHLCGLHSNEQ